MKKILLLLILSVVLCLPTSCVVDESETPLKFKILSDNTLEVIKDDSYQELNSVSVPAKVRIDGKIYSVTSIGEGAFANCSSLASIEIPKSVTSIKTSAFGDCNSLKSINVATNNPMYSSENGVLYNKNKTVGIYIPPKIEPQLLIYDNGTKCCWIGDKEKCTKVVIPEGVTSISEYAFWNYSSLTSIEIPNSVTSIGSEAFEGCSRLASIKIPNSVTSIGDYAFSDCNRLASIEIPNSVTSIGHRAFERCSNLTSIEIPNSVTSISKGAFAGCSGLTSIKIPNSVTSIDDHAFAGCRDLDIVIDNSKENITKGNGAFSGCKSVTWSKE